jgi:hypothetical protein
VEATVNDVRRHLQQENAGKPRRERIRMRHEQVGPNDWRFSIYFPSDMHPTSERIKSIAKAACYTGELTSWFFKARQNGMNLNVADQQWVSDQVHGPAYRIQFSISGRSRTHLQNLDAAMGKENEVHPRTQQIRAMTTRKTLSLYFPTRHAARTILAFLESGGRH